MHEISHTPNNKKFPKFRNDCFNVSRLLFSNSGFIFHSQRSKQSLKPQRACPWRKIYGSMFFRLSPFFFYQNHPKRNEMFTPWTKNLYLFCCSIISWKLFRGSLIHVRIGAASKMLFTGNYASEMSVSLISDRILAVPVQASTRMLHSRAALARVCVCARAAILTRTHVNWTWASTSPPPRSPSLRFGGGLGRMEGGGVFVCQVPRPSRLCALPDSASP